MSNQLDPTSMPFRPRASNVSQPPFFTRNRRHYQQQSTLPDFGPAGPQRQPSNFHAQNATYGQPPFAPHHPRRQRQLHPPPHQWASHPLPPAAAHQVHFPTEAPHEDSQYAVEALIEHQDYQSCHADLPNRVSGQSFEESKKTNQAKAKTKGKSRSAINGLDPQDVPQLGATRIEPSRYDTQKTMLPAPQPDKGYLSQASGPSSIASRPGQILVILDLNGTLLFRPNKKSKARRMIARPCLDRFLRYLFQHFKVMVWSSAKPANVDSLVEQALETDLRSKLVATWARDSFGLSSMHYNKNVQVYKNLDLIWSRDTIQQHHPQYLANERFGQHNTVLIDDSILKASAQPFNLLKIPEFEATPEQMKDNILREVAGYLEEVRQQTDVSRFIKKEPFTGDGRWQYEWSPELQGGELKPEVIKQSIKSKHMKTPVTAHTAKITVLPVRVKVD